LKSKFFRPLTIEIKFKFNNRNITSYQRHIIWQTKYLWGWRRQRCYRWRQIADIVGDGQQPIRLKASCVAAVLWNFECTPFVVVLSTACTIDAQMYNDIKSSLFAEIKMIKSFPSHLAHTVALISQTPSVDAW